MEFQSTLNNYGVPMNNYSNGNGSLYNNDSYYNGGYQTNLNQFDSYGYQSNLNQFDNRNMGIYPSDRNFGQVSTGGYLHETFKVDRYDNIYGGHTTYDFGNNQKVHMPWDSNF